MKKRVDLPRETKESSAVEALLGQIFYDGFAEFIWNGKHRRAEFWQCFDAETLAIFDEAEDAMSKAYNTYREWGGDA